MKMISVVMSVYNEPIEFVDKAIQSIIDQTYTDFEFIIILDKPDNHEMLAFIRSKAAIDERIRFYVNETNIGLARSLNKGIEAADGRYIARMDADDISKPQRLERELRFIEERRYDMVCCLVDKIDAEGEIWDTIKPFPEKEELVSLMLPVQNIVVHPTVMMKTDCIRKMGGYRPFSSCQDYDLWLRMLTGGYRIGILNESLLYFRRHPNSISSSKRYVQFLNEKYIRSLYFERVNCGRDSFSEDKLKQYFVHNGAGNRKKADRENRLFSQYRQGIKDIKERKFIKGIITVFLSLRGCAVRDTIKISVQARKSKKKLGMRVRRTF